MLTRKETYLSKLSGEDISIPAPITREEFYLAKLCGEDVEIPPPITAAEFYLAALCGESVTPPQPITRLQMIWGGKISGTDPDITPKTREEQLWAAYEPQEITWRTVEKYGSFSVYNAMAHSVRSFKRYGACIWGTANRTLQINNGTLIAKDDELPLGYGRYSGFEFRGRGYFHNFYIYLTGADTVRLTIEANEYNEFSGMVFGSPNYYLQANGTTLTVKYGASTYEVTIQDPSVPHTVTISPTGTTGFDTNATWEPIEFIETDVMFIGSVLTIPDMFKGNIIGNVEIVGRAKLIPTRDPHDYQGVYSYYNTYTGSKGTTLSQYIVSYKGRDYSHMSIEVDGQTETVAIGNNTAIVPDLYGVYVTSYSNDGDDECDLVSGVIIRRCAVCVYDGTQDIGNYWIASDTISGGRPAVGAIVIYRTGQEVIEHIAPQSLRTDEGTNAVTSTSITSTLVTIEYAMAAGAGASPIVGVGQVGFMII